MAKAQIDESFAKPINLDFCRQYIEENIFQLRPEKYGESYPLWPGTVGLEVEMLPLLNSSTGCPSPLPLQGEKQSLASSLRKIAKSEKWQVVEDQADVNENKQILNIQLDEEDQLTFEPGGQLEFSSKPYPCLSDAVRRLRSIQAKLDSAAKEDAWDLVQIGANPWHTISEVGLQMSKNRYKAMDSFFSNIGPYGQRMMRQTCTIQTCIDFGPNEEVMAKRFLAGQLLSPFATAIFAHSPFIDHKNTGMPGYRSWIWRHLDNSRTGFPELGSIAENFDKKSCVEAYLQYALEAKVVFVEKENFHVPNNNLTFNEWMKSGYLGRKPDKSDLETQISLLFPEVRPRGFLELRAIDSQARAWQVVPTIFYTGLLYDDKKLDVVLEKLLPHRKNLDQLLLLSAKGLENSEISKISKELMSHAIEGFSNLPPCFQGEGSEKSIQTFSKHFTQESRTPANDMIDAYQSLRTDQNFDFNFIRKIHSSWEDLIEKG